MHAGLLDLEIVQQLSESALRVLIAFLRLNDPATGTFDPGTGRVRATIAELEWLSGLKQAAVYKGLGELSASSRRLLEKQTPTGYIVMPGWRWAGRSSGPAAPPGDGAGAATIGVRRSAAWPSSTPVERCSTAVERDSAAVEAPPARRDLNSSQPEENKEQSRPEPGGRSENVPVADWRARPENLSVTPVLERVEQRLRELRVRDPMLREALGIEGLTVAEIDETYQRVAGDRTVTNPPVMLVRRLFESRGLKPPGKRTGALSTLNPDDLCRLQRARAERFGAGNR